MGFFTKRERLPRLDELLPEEDRKLELLLEASESILCEDESEDIDPRLPIELYKEAIRNEPQEFIYNYMLGIAYFQAGDSEKAKESLEKACSLKPDDPRPIYTIGVIYYIIWEKRDEEQAGQTREQEYMRVKEILSTESVPYYLRLSGEEIVRDFEARMRDPDYEERKRIEESCQRSPVSLESSKANALQYFRKVLACKLHPEDRKAVEGHIAIIESVSRARTQET